MRRTMTALGLAALLLAGAGVAWAQEKVDLKENARVNDTMTRTASMSMEINVKQGTEQVIQKVVVRHEEVIGEKILAVEKGRATSIRRHYVKETQTNHDAAAQGPVTQNGENQGRIFVITGVGAAAKVECLNDAVEVDALKNKVKNVPQGMILPGKAVAVGETWDVAPDVLKQLFLDGEEKGPSGTAVKCKLLALEDRKGVKSAKIGLEMTIVSEPEPGTTMVWNVKGEAWFSVETGMFLGWDMKGTITMKGGNEEMSMTGEGPVTILETVELGKADLGDESKKLERKAEPGGEEGSHGEAK